MHKWGHVGAALFVYAPIGLALVLAGFGDLAALGGVGMVALASLPDADQRLPVAHRGPTHSLAFAALLGLALGVAGFAFGGRVAALPAVTMGSFAFGIGALAVIAHIAADSITPMGIRPFWPVSRWHYSANLVRAKNPIANYLLLAAGIAAATGVLVLAAELA